MQNEVRKDIEANYKRELAESGTKRRTSSMGMGMMMMGRGRGGK
jgi:hypothetical protein